MSEVTEIERLKTENNLLKRELDEAKKNFTAKKYENLYLNSPLGILTVSKNGNIIDANPRLIELLGSPSIEQTKLINLLTFEPLINAGMSAKLSESIKTAQNCQGNGYYVTKWGKELYLRYLIIPLFTENTHDFEYLQCIISDATDFLKANETLATHEKNLMQLSSAVEQSSNVVVITDTQGLIEYVNPKFTEVSGYTKDEVVGKNINFFKSGIHDKKFYANLWETISSGKTWIGEFHNRHKNGKIFYEHAVISPIFDNNGNIINYLAVKENVTLLKESQNRLKTLINNSPDAIFFKDGDGRWLEVNPVGRKLFQLENIEYQGLTDLELSQLGTFYSEAFLACSTSDEDSWLNVKTTYNTEHIPLPNGKVQIFDVVKTPLFNDDGSRLGLVIIGRDITERQAAADALQKKSDEYYALYEEHKNQNLSLTKAIVRAEQSDRLKTEFLHNMSHEIRTPLNGILGFSQLLGTPDLAQEKQESFISIIQNSGKQLLRIIDDILEVSRLETKQSEVSQKKVNLNNLIMRLFSKFDLISKEKKIPFYLNKTLTDSECEMLIDDEKLEKILTHLLENAFKFTHGGYVELGYIIDNKLVDFYVRDTGIGIREDKLNVIFERFAQEEEELSRTYGGLGLGLSIAAENAQLMGGKITVHSEKGSGSTFFVELPYRPTSENREKIEKNSNTATHFVLIAEDEEINYLYLETVLLTNYHNIRVIHVHNGKEALRYIAGENPADLILMDIKMPEMNGYEATKEIKKLRPNCVIVMQTGYSTGDDRLKAHLCGADDFLSKPISSESLTGIIDKYIH